MVEVPRVGRIDPNVFFATADGSRFLRLASASGEPEQDLDNFAAANPVPNQGEDVFLTEAEWQMLSGQSYAEDIGNGTIAQVVVDPISSANPNGVIRLYLNYRQVVTVNPQYQPENGGWHEQTSNEATYSYETGAQTSSGNRSTGGGGEPPPLEMLWTPYEKQQQEERVYREHPRFAHFLDTFLPERAYAQVVPYCAPFMRNALIGLAGMAWAGRTGNIPGFLLAWASVVNNIHACARCQEQRQRQ